MADDKEIKESQIRDELRFNEQCFLLDNWEQIVAYNVETTKFKKGYKNFKIIQGEPGLVTHDLVGKKGIKALLEIRTEQISLLMPLIKISKIAYPTKDGKHPIDKPLFFRDYTNSQTIENITKNRIGRGDEVGLKSFSYELAGRNLAEGGTAKATLKIFFQNVSSLVYDVSPTQASFKDLIMPQKKFNERQVKDAQTGEVIKKDREYNSEYFRIKIESGWANPVDPSGAVFSQLLKKSISSSRTILFMSLLKHEFDFKEDGSVELTIEYQGAIEAALNDRKSDILSLTEYGKNAEKNREEVSENRKKRKRTQRKEASVKKTFEPSNSKDKSIDNSDLKSKDPDVASDSKKIKDAIEQEAIDKQIRYSRIIRRLIGSSRMHYIDVDKKFIEGFNEEQKDEIEERRDRGDVTDKEAQLAKRQQTQLGRRQYGKLKIVRIEGSENYNKLEENNLGILKSSAETILQVGNVQKVKKGLFSFGVKTEEVSRSEMSSKVTAWENSLAPISTPKGKPDDRRINYFYFGDLLDIALEVLSDRSDLKNFSVLVGPIAFKDPRNPKSAPKLINLADIPISLNLFITWYMKEVIAPLREKYYFDSFIKDVINTLILPALGEDCFLVGQNQQHTISMTTFSAPGIGPKGKRQNPLNTFTIDKSPVPSVNTFKTTHDNARKNWQQIKSQNKPSVRQMFAQSTHHSSADLYHFLYIYVSSWKVMGLDGKKSTNDALGIYHLFPAADKGLVKSIKFNKQDQPYVAEMRATQDSKSSKRLRDRYDCSIRMVGNDLFRPGMYVYVDTSKFGLGSPMELGGTSKDKSATAQKSIASELGLGGYYQVVKITQNVGKDDYETELDCKWITSGGETIQTPVEKQTAGFRAYQKAAL